eukprot:CAMPEP_0116824248 /NCGR_PEP_ID=MMETSP0418-20121206/1290_1 /TAXON_ID=1158023 /ORGANISM="Astrosyne radiata, Strain 13vi08-1A" /LENGTH=247 /DNA_ID=CAMNT_0004452595 /DNA_START=158 /DNA_END=901 /DNA_ORIENTATION=-
MALVQLYVIPHHFVSLMRLNPDDVKAVNAKSEDRRGTGMLTLPESRAILEGYLHANELMGPKGQTTLDGPLSDALYKTKKKGASSRPGGDDDNIPTSISLKELMNRWVSKMEAAYALVAMPDNHVVRLGRGSPPKVVVEVSMRQGRKFLTRVRGLEDFGLDSLVVCRDVSKRFACSGAVETDPTRPHLKKGHIELVFQGHLVEELRALLLGDERLTRHGGAKDSDYCIPKSCLEVELKKGVPAKKKK